jgi:hypothetical protein
VMNRMAYWVWDRISEMMGSYSFAVSPSDVPSCHH